ncbi:MAG: type II toxin-antitoxin system PemK/MazF family toxin [Gemmatimonadaceae bacterium]|nr:type II toxin-antitoxin system PemK/MazF family toxin [Gemmatimonadaceae bacterium]
MAFVGAVTRWDLYWADLDPAVGSEQGGAHRPVLVVSNDGFNAAFTVVTIIPFTKTEGKRRRVYSFEVLVPKGIVTAAHSSILMPQQIRTIAKTRLHRRIGAISDASLQSEIEARVLEHLGIAFEAELH